MSHSQNRTLMQLLPIGFFTVPTERSNKILTYELGYYTWQDNICIL
jgi:hypothetical protein